MSAAENKAIVLRYIEGLNKHDDAVAREIFSPTCVRHMSGVTTTGGYAGGSPAARGWDACPDWRYDVQVVLAEDDKVAVSVAAGGTHTGAWERPTGTYPPTGKRVTTTWTAVYRLSGGRIVEVWHNADMLGLLRQWEAGLAAQQDPGEPATR